MARSEGVFIRRRQLVFAAVFLGLFAFSTLALSTSLDPTKAYHSLQYISRSDTDQTLVDNNNNGQVDKADLADDSSKLNGYTSDAFRKGCVTADTGTSGNSNTGWQSLDLRLGGKNICSEGSGCTFTVIRYDATNGVPKNIYHSGPYQWFQFSNGNWISYDEKVGKNGDTTETKFMNAWGSNWNDAQIWDDHSGTETDADHVSVRDQAFNAAFIFIFCD